MILLKLFWTFLKIGIFTFGGGYSMVALIQNEVVEKQGWLTAQEYTDILAISQMTPGPVGINTATYAGYTAVVNSGLPVWEGILGSLLASFAVILLPIIAMWVVYSYLSRHRENPVVDTMFRILRLTVVGLIAAAALLLLTKESFGIPGLNKQFIVSILLFAAVFYFSYWKRTNPILLILASGLVGLVVYSF
ncbi:MAG: chromate transporter [Bacteroidales bacterium]|nr:chromate transporter [Bacteroidales bacterium]